MRLFMIMAAIAVLSGEASAGPELLIEPSEFEFGLAPQKSTISHSFWFKSIGDDTIVINEIKTGCACATMPLPSDRLAPGDSMLVSFFWELRLRTGAAGKYPYIFTNAGPDPYRVNLTALAMPRPDSARPVSFRPHKLELSKLASRSIDSITFTVTNHSSGALAIKLVSREIEECQVTMPKSLPAGSSRGGSIVIKPGYREAEFKRSLTFELSDAAKTRITVPIRRKIYQTSATVSR